MIWSTIPVDNSIGGDEDDESDVWLCFASCFPAQQEDCDDEEDEDDEGERDEDEDAVEEEDWARFSEEEQVSAT